MNHANINLSDAPMSAFAKMRMNRVNAAHRAMRARLLAAGPQGLLQALGSGELGDVQVHAIPIPRELGEALSQAMGRRDDEPKGGVH